MASDGTQLRQLTTDGTQPEVDRDGQQIAYVRPAGIEPRFFYTPVWVMNADGSNQHEVYVPPPAPPCNYQFFCFPVVAPTSPI